MRINTSKKALAAALDLLVRVIPSRSSNPTLTAVLVDLHSQGLTLTGTNLEVDLALDVPAEIGLGDEGSRLLLPAHLLHAAVKRSGGEMIELEATGQKVVMRSAGGKAEFVAHDPGTYAPMSFAQGGFSVDPEALHRAFQSIAYAASKQAFQAVFRGVLVQVDASGGLCVASDGYRVATARFPVLDSGVEARMIVPERSLATLMPLVDRATELRLFPGEGLLTLTTADARANVRLIDGDFPDWQRVIPKNIVLSATLPSRLLREALERVSLFTDSNANNRVELTFADGAVRIGAQGDYGSGEEVLQAQIGGSASAVAVAMNCRHLLDASGPIEGDLTMHLSGSTSPVIVQPMDSDSPRAVSVTLRGEV